MRFAGDMFKEPMSESRRSYEALQDKPIVPGFNTEDLVPTPELKIEGFQGPGTDLLKDHFIRTQPGSGISILPGGMQGPAQGPNTPIKNYGGRYQPDGTQPSGYKPSPRASIEGQEVAALPAFLAGPALVKGAAKAYSAYQTGKFLLDGGAVNPGTRADYNNQDPTTKYNRRKQNDYRGPASQSLYHQ